MQGAVHDPTKTGIDNQLLADKEREDSETGLVMSAIKRDRGIKDWGHLIAELYIRLLSSLDLIKEEPWRRERRGWSGFRE